MVNVLSYGLLGLGCFSSSSIQPLPEKRFVRTLMKFPALGKRIDKTSNPVLIPIL